MQKRGFTLIELLAVIALLGIVIVFAVPNVVNVFKSNKGTLSSIQKEQLRSAVKMYLNDYCTEPISDDYICDEEHFSTSINENNIIYVKTGEIDLEDFAKTNYFEEEQITNNCSGSIVIINGEIDLSGITCNFSK